VEAVEVNRVESLRRLLNGLPDDAGLRSAAVLVVSAGMATEPDEHGQRIEEDRNEAHSSA
jgi:hypothetical protein